MIANRLIWILEPKVLSSICIVLLVVSFACKPSNSHFYTKAKTTNASTSKRNEICSDSVLWYIRLSEGFAYDSVKFIINEGVFPDSTLPNPWIVTTTESNGCSNVHFYCYQKYDKNIIYLSNMPKFSELQENKRQPIDSLIMKIVVNKDTFDLKSSLKYQRYFSLNYNRKNRGLVCFRRETCFFCY